MARTPRIDSLSPPEKHMGNSYTEESNCWAAAFPTAWLDLKQQVGSVCSSGDRLSGVGCPLASPGTASLRVYQARN